MTAERWLTPVDRRLLSALGRTPNLVRAARSVGITRDRAVYRLQRIRRLYGHPAALGRRGGGAVGTTTLTPFGRRLARPLRSAPSAANRWRGIYGAEPSPHVDLGGGRALAVAFRARTGEPVVVEVDPESFVLARRPFPSSARNLFAATLESLRPLSPGRILVTARWKGLRVRATLTPGSMERLRLTPGLRAYFFLKAVAIRSR